MRGILMWRKKGGWGGELRPVKEHMKEYENLLSLKILDCGHMVPIDLPATSLDMMRTFLFGGGRV